MKKWLKKWWFSILWWVIACVIYTVMFLWLNSDEELYIIGACGCAYMVLGFMCILAGMFNVPEKEDKKYQRYKDFLEWYEKQKENKDE